MSLRMIAAVMIGYACVACGHLSSSNVVAPDDPRLRYAGVFDKSSPKSVRFAWPGTHVSALFRGTSLQVRLTDTPVEDETRETDWLTVVIDDQNPKTFALAEGDHIYPLASGLPPGVHRVLLWKRTEAEVGTVTFHGFVLDRGATIVAPPRPLGRRMHFVGDSITAGYGNEGRDAACHWSAATENNYETYGARAARELRAEYVAAAWSGKGLIRNYDKRDTVTLPQVYDRVIPTDDTSPLAIPEPADVVVINLGTNDFFLGIPNQAEFIAAYRKLVDALRTQHPDALFILAVGPMLADDYPQPQARSLMRTWLTTVQDQLRASGDDKVELIELWTDPVDGVGCDFHPNLKTHARMGRELAEQVRKRLNW